jgi:methionyl-tRNA formyltransferase
MTDVPYGRGGSPLQNLIEAGHQETRLSALRIIGELDAGPVYKKMNLSLHGRAEDIYIRAGRQSFEVIRWIIREQPEPIPQIGKPVIFKRRTPEQSRLPKSGNLTNIYNHIRMLDAPTYPQAFLVHGDFLLEFSHAEIGADGQLTVKTVIKNIKN